MIFFKTLVITMKMKTIICKSFLFAIPLFAFQCNRWTNHAEKVEIYLTPQNPTIVSDTLTFEIEIITQEDILKKCKSVSYQLFLSNEIYKETIDTFSVEEINFNRLVTQKIDPNKSFKQIEIKSMCDKKDISSDFLVIAELKQYKNTP